MHPVIGLEEGARQCYECAIAWVIEGLDAGNPLAKMRLRLLNIGNELGLGIRRACNKYRAGLGDRLRDALEELVVNRRMAAVTGIRFMVNMLIGMRTADGCVIDIRSVELKHLGLAVINPYHHMIVATHGVHLEVAGILTREPAVAQVCTAERLAATLVRSLGL